MSISDAFSQSSNFQKQIKLNKYGNFVIFITYQVRSTHAIKQSTL